MIPSFYSAADGLLARAMHSDVIAGNVAGAAVTGHRRQTPLTTAFARHLELAREPAVHLPPSPLLLNPSTQLDLRPGPLRATGRPLDVAVSEGGYLCVEIPGGQGYLPSASLQVTAEGRLLTSDGRAVLSEEGVLEGLTGEVEIRPSGDVLVAGDILGRLRLVTFAPDAHALPLGNGALLVDPAHTLPAGPEVHLQTGYLEGTNVDIVHEMASLIALKRAFEANQRALQVVDRTLEVAIHEIGRV